MEYKIEKGQVLEALKVAGCELLENCDEMYHFKTKDSYFRYRVSDYIVDVAQIDSFDRWANSTCSHIIIQHVNFDNCDGDWGWREVDVVNNIIEQVKDCDTINGLLPKRLFDKFLKYEL